MATVCGRGYRVQRLRWEVPGRSVEGLCWRALRGGRQHRWRRYSHVCARSSITVHVHPSCWSVFVPFSSLFVSGGANSGPEVSSTWEQPGRRVSDTLPAVGLPGGQQHQWPGNTHAWAGKRRYTYIHTHTQKACWWFGGNDVPPTVRLVHSLASSDQDVIVQALKHPAECSLKKDGLHAVVKLLKDPRGKVSASASSVLRSLSVQPRRREQVKSKVIYGWSERGYVRKAILLFPNHTLAACWASCDHHQLCPNTLVWMQALVSCLELLEHDNVDTRVCACKALACLKVRLPPPIGMILTGQSSTAGFIYLCFLWRLSGQGKHRPVGLCLPDRQGGSLRGC